MSGFNSNKLKKKKKKKETDKWDSKRKHKSEKYLFVCIRKREATRKPRVESLAATIIVCAFLSRRSLSLFYGIHLNFKASLAVWVICKASWRKANWLSGLSLSQLSAYIYIYILREFMVHQYIRYTNKLNDLDFILYLSQKI